MRKLVPLIGGGNEGRGYIVKATMLNGRGRWLRRKPSMTQNVRGPVVTQRRALGEMTVRRRRRLRARFMCVGQDCVDNGT